jgi:DNA-binding SARP family transcriptional activator
VRFSILGPFEVTHEGVQIELSPDKAAIIALLIMADGKPL